MLPNRQPPKSVKFYIFYILTYPLSTDIRKERADADGHCRIILNEHTTRRCRICIHDRQGQTDQPKTDALKSVHTINSQKGGPHICGTIPPAHKQQVSESLNIMKISFKRLLALLLVCCLAFPAPAAAQTAYVKGSLTGTQRLDIAYQFLDELNSYRAQHGVGKLKMDDALLDYATQRGAELMVVCEHQRPDGTGVFETPLLHNKWAGETCLMTSLSDSVPSAAKSILNSFRSSAPHDKILKMKEFSYVGIGVVEIGYHMYCVSVDFCSEGREMAKTTKNTKKTWTFNVKPSLFEGLFVTQTPLYAGGTPQKAVVSGTNVHRKQVSLTYDIDQSPVSSIKSLNTDILDVKNGYLVPKKEGNATLTATVNGKKVSTMVFVRKGTGTSPETKQESLTDGIEKTGTEGTAGSTKQTAEAKQITPNGAYMIAASADPAKGIAVKNNSIKMER